MRQIEPPTPSYVKRKKRRAALWILVGATGAGVLTLGIIAFLGQNFGSFTVKLNNDEDASLQMGEVLAENARGTSLKTPSTYLNVGGLTSSSCITVSDLPSASILDSDITTENYDDVMYAKKVAKAKTDGGQVTSDDSQGTYFNFTFYVRNISAETVTYSVKYYCTENTMPSNLYDADGKQQSVSLEKFIRIRVYQNLFTASADTTTHYQETFAYPKTTDGTNLPEAVGDPEGGPEESASCTNFSEINLNKSLFTVFDKQGLTLPGDSIMRYSVVMWFEGYDSEAQDPNYSAPLDASLAFAIDITGKKSRSLESSSSVSIN